jgi:hypothetical protein
LGIEKLDPGGLEGGDDLDEGLRPGLGGSPLEIGDRLLRDFRVRDEVLLRPVEQRAGGAALRGERVINPLSTLLMWTRQVIRATSAV